MAFRFRVVRCGHLPTARVTYADGVLEHGVVRRGDEAVLQPGDPQVVRITSVALVDERFSSGLLTVTVELPSGVRPEDLVGCFLVQEDSPSTPAAPVSDPPP